MYTKAGEWTRNLLWGRRCEKTGKRMMAEEEQFLSFRLWKEHKGVVFLFGLFTLLFSAFYLILIGGWQAEGAAELGKLIIAFGLLYMGPGIMCSLLGSVLLAGQSEERYFLFLLRRLPGFAVEAFVSGIIGFLSSIGVVIGLFLTVRRRGYTEKEREKYWKKFADGSVGYAVNAEENAAWLSDNNRNNTEGAAVILSCGLMASLGNLMLSSSLGEGKLPGKAFDRGLEIYVRLKSYFDRLVKSGAAVILSCSVTAMSAFVYDANNVVRLGMLGTGRKHDRSIAVSALAEWARAVGIDNKTIPSGLLAFVLWLLIAATVCLYGYHFYRCFRLYFWNETWEATYREKLEHSGVAPNISTVPFPKW